MKNRAVKQRRMVFQPAFGQQHTFSTTLSQHASVLDCGDDRTRAGRWMPSSTYTRNTWQDNVSVTAFSDTASSTAAAVSTQSAVDICRQQLSVVISFCSNERDLLLPTITPLVNICHDIKIPVCSHLFDGVTEDVEGVRYAHTVAQQFPAGVVEVVQVPYRDVQGNIPNKTQFWHQEMRMNGFARTKNQWILFLDADEVLRDADAFVSWFADTVRYSNKCSFKLANYWYFMSKRRRAVQLEDSIVLCNRTFLPYPVFRISSRERENFYDHVPEQLKERGVRGKNGQVFFDHFSWVRSKDAMLQKVSCWGHKNDKSNWKELVLKAFEEDPFTTPDFIHGANYQYEILQDQNAQEEQQQEQEEQQKVELQVPGMSV
jgi:hypothetical protein